jgi:two-component system, NtrC family, nitrogen regulation response regulator NtrX
MKMLPSVMTTLGDGDGPFCPRRSARCFSHMTGVIPSFPGGRYSWSDRRDVMNERLRRVSGDEFAIVSESRSIQADLNLDIDCAIVSDVHVLISGVDRDAGASLARLLHDCSLRKRGPLVVLDRAWMAGASASDLRARISTTAARGTVFIDEVAAMSPAMQSALLRILDVDREVLADGPSCREVRIVAATMWNLFDAVRAHGFHADLFYRLNAVHLAFEAAPARQTWMM